MCDGSQHDKFTIDRPKGACARASRHRFDETPRPSRKLEVVNLQRPRFFQASPSMPRSGTCLPRRSAKGRGACNYMAARGYRASTERRHPEPHQPHAPRVRPIPQRSSWSARLGGCGDASSVSPPRFASSAAAGELRRASPTRHRRVLGRFETFVLSHKHEPGYYGYRSARPYSDERRPSLWRQRRGVYPSECQNKPGGTWYESAMVTQASQAAAAILKAGYYG